MKLLYCMSCHDIRKLHSDITRCKCGKTSGRYVSDVNAEYAGSGYLLGISNSDFATIVRSYRQDNRQNLPFKIFTIPSSAPTATRLPFLKEKT